jgi:hypothetical protein
LYRLSILNLLEDVMEVLYWILGIIALIILATIAYGTISIGRARIIVPDRYEWLEVLSHIEWKHRRAIALDMGKLKGMKVDLSTFSAVIYSDLALLLEEGLIEENKRMSEPYLDKGYTLLFDVYRLTPAGLRKRLEKGDLKSTEPGIEVPA